MKYLLDKISAILVFFVFSIVIHAQIPEKPQSQRLVNDYANFLSQDKAQLLESKLVAFNQTTSTQIVIVIVSDLNNYAPAQFAYEIGEKWGVGQKDKNNGIVFLIKPKTATSKGEVNLSVGYGLEGVVPDAVAKRIVEFDILPRFREGDYYGGIDIAVNQLISLTKKEFTADQYLAKTERKSPIGLLLIVAIILIIVFINNYKNVKRNNIGNSSLPFWIAMGMMSSGHRSGGGSFGGFSSGGGGFSGFGGGSFGGGGAGGSW